MIGMRLGAGLLLWCVAVTGCQTVVDGAAQPADHLGVLTSAPTTTPKPRLPQDNLLSTADVAGIVGEAAVRQTSMFTAPADDAVGVDPGSCAHRIYPAQRFVYQGWVQLAGTIMQGAGKRRVAQLVATFKKDDNARGAVMSAEAVWKGCSEPFTVTTDNVVAHWTPNPVTGDLTRATTSTQKEADPPAVCQHVLTDKGSYVVETVVCGEDGQTARQADEISEQILAKIPG